MNKVILSLPKSILKKYVSNHFSELSEEDFFQLSKKIVIPSEYFRRNDNLNKNAKILSYMLDIDKYAFEHFDPEAFSAECIDKIANSEIEIKRYYPNKYPMFLKNSKLCERMIQSIPIIVEKLEESQITESIISSLEQSDYVPNSEALNKFPSFLKSEILMERAVSIDSMLILKISEPSDHLILTALENGFVPEKKYFLDNPNLRTNQILLEKAFENNPSIIVFFEKDQITTNLIMSAQSRGFIANEDDFRVNPSLCNNQYIMEDAIMHDSRLIAFLGGDCNIRASLVQEALGKYKITKEDLKRNPSLTKNSAIMAMLPEFSLYYAYLSDRQKEEAIAKNLKKFPVLTIDNLPFLDGRFGGKAHIDSLNELVKCFNLSINEDDMDLQQKYFQVLDKVVNGIVNIRYTQNKFSFKYPDIVAMNDSLVQLFTNVSLTKNYELLSDYVKDLHTFLGKTISIEQLKGEVERFYHIYIDNNTIGLSVTSEFCNAVLNEHRNYFVSREKSKILRKIEGKMKLTKKREMIILNGRKMKKTEGYIRAKDYEQLGISEHQFLVEVENVKNSILANKDIKKKGIQIDIQRLDFIANEFVDSGSLDEQFVNDILKIKNIEVSKFIAKKFDQIKFKYTGKVTLTEEESYISKFDKQKLEGLNQTNYVLGDSDRCIKNLSELLVKLDQETVTKILVNRPSIMEVSFLLPFLDLVEELDVNTFVNILVDYDRIKNRILHTLDSSEEVDFATIVANRIDDVISLANAYSSVDDITLFALGRNVVSEVGEHNSSKYLEFYTHMLNKQNGGIPPVFLQTSSYHLESGMYSDPERLLIGKKPDEKSCIDLLNCAGVETYNEVLLQNSGDVILVRNAENNLVSRILLFRRGNVVQMVTRAGENLPVDLYKSVADQIVQQSISNNDNIEYVFVNNLSSTNQPDNCFSVKDNRFINNFAHADLSDSAILLNSKKRMQGFSEKELQLNFFAEPLVSYEKPRKKISTQPTETEITRLRALKISMETNPVVKETMARNFEPFYSKGYTKVVCGEDWYVAVKKDGTVEEDFLPVNDIRIRAEIERAKFDLGINDSISLNDEETEMTEESHGIRR